MANLEGDSATLDIPAVSALHSTGGNGVHAASEQGIAVRAVAHKDTGIFATSESGIGLDTRSTSNLALHAKSEQGIAVRAIATKDTGVFATSEGGIGLDARSTTNLGLHAASEQGIALRAIAHKDTGIFATSESGIGVDARSTSNLALHAKSEQGIAVRAIATKDTGVFATSESGIGLDARSQQGIGIYGKGGSYAGFFDGIVMVTGDIQLQNADCAEEFDIVDAANVEPGTVMVIDTEGSLRQSTESYDTRVAGIISGAGDLRPGMVLGKQPGTSDRLPIALVGRVYCKVDADHGSIQVGDLLTTSPTPGHAMKASAPSKAFGAVLGKALRPICAGQALIPVLVTLQ